MSGSINYTSLNEVGWSRDDDSVANDNVNDKRETLMVATCKDSDAQVNKRKRSTCREPTISVSESTLPPGKGLWCHHRWLNLVEVDRLVLNNEPRSYKQEVPEDLYMLMQDWLLRIGLDPGYEEILDAVQGSIDMGKNVRKMVKSSELFQFSLDGKDGVWIIRAPRPNGRICSQGSQRGKVSLPLAILEMEEVECSTSEDRGCQVLYVNFFPMFRMEADNQDPTEAYIEKSAPLGHVEASKGKGNERAGQHEEGAGTDQAVPHWVMGHLGSWDPSESTLMAKHYFITIMLGMKIVQEGDRKTHDPSRGNRSRNEKDLHCNHQAVKNTIVG
ncbi:hypothetical protein E2542_SST27463 [Spatholobus suberectus]|nr:hypothetical protein E2542_SST27463 [Spatholobus suberectus]